jgi:glutamyl-tRNA synthetase
LTDVLVRTIPYLSNKDTVAKLAAPQKHRQLAAAMPGLKERAKTLVELADSALYLVAERPLTLDEKAAALLDDEGKTVLREIHPLLDSSQEWTAAALDNIARAHAESRNLKLGKVAQPLRAALTGRATSPGVFDVLEVLGREESLGRIADQIR